VLFTSSDAINSRCCDPLAKWTIDEPSRERAAVGDRCGPEVRFEEMTAQAVNQRAQTDVISRKPFPDSFRIGDRRSRTMPQVSLDP
jgi:hypothetical protein